MDLPLLVSGGFFFQQRLCSALASEWSRTQRILDKPLSPTPSPIVAEREKRTLTVASSHFVHL